MLEWCKLFFLSFTTFPSLPPNPTLPNFVLQFFVCFSHYTKASLEHEDKLDGFRGKLHYQTQQQVLFPAVAPDTCPPLAVQPCSAPLFVPVGFATAHVPAQPMRIRGKGLLERQAQRAVQVLNAVCHAAPPAEKFCHKFKITCTYKPACI